MLKTYLPGVSSIAAGCMGLGGGWNRDLLTAEHRRQAHEFVDAALASRINMFDHADIYTFGKAEQVFGDVLAERPHLRDQIILQSKCGIRFADEPGPKRYDFSKDWIVKSVQGILQRLQTDYLDVLTLHRPDPLMEPEEVAEAFQWLFDRGLVRHFGVSNMNVAQIGFLQNHLPQPLVVNQMEISLSHTGWLDDGVEVNLADSNPGYSHSHFGSGLLEYCRTNNVQLQAWGCLSQGLFTGRDLTDQPENIKKTAALVAQLAQQLAVSPEAVVLAWIQRHPASIQPVIGTIRPERIKACAQAMAIQLTREQWYQLYIAARGSDIP